MPVLKWIPEEDEAEIRRVFEMTLAVRGESQDAKTIADTYFFETLVRVHRASEGKGFTGLKPAGQVDPAFVATDRALANGNIDALAEETAAAVEEAIRRRFTVAYEKGQVAEDSVEQGRECVAAYVQLTHFVEGVHHLVSGGASPLHPRRGYRRGPSPGSRRNRVRSALQGRRLVRKRVVQSACDGRRAGAADRA